MSRILHAGYLFECAGTRLVFDPIFENPFSRNCHAFPQVEFDLKEIRRQRWDAVFISHHHDDHCSLESLNLLDRQTPILIYCVHEELFDWVRALGFTNVTSLRLNHPYQVGPFTITPRRALDADVDSIFQIEVAGTQILNVVDSWIDPDMLAHLQLEGRWDLILWPFQAMRELEVLSPSRSAAASSEIPDEHGEQLQLLRPRYLVPSSCQFKQEDWSWYNKAFFPVSYESFSRQMRELLPQTQVLRMNPGTSIRLEQGAVQSAPGLMWIHPMGEQNVDYEYDPKMKVPSTADIAQNFGALNDEQRAEIDQFCFQDLPSRYMQRGPPDLVYFARPRLWRLVIYDHQGQAQVHHYQVSAGSMKRLEQPQQPLAWLTEVPAARLWGALNQGESLTSMYLRINDQSFGPDIEKELANTELLEDPLIVALFTNEFGAYQKTQLRNLSRLKGTEK